MKREIDLNLKYKHYVCIDEAGRGNCAGEMVFCGVKIPNGHMHPEELKDIPHYSIDYNPKNKPVANSLRSEFAKDSKKLTKSKRQNGYFKFQRELEYKIVVISPDMIDEFGLSKCITMALYEIINHFPNQRYLYDGKSKFGCKVNSLETMIKADDKVSLVGAASVMAKTIKDQLMVKHDRDYPEYGFESNSGYGTAKHVDAIREFGYTPIHRMTYNIKALKNNKIKMYKGK